MAPDLLLPICSMLLAFGVGKIAAHVFKIKKERRGIFCTNFFIANTMFIGLPVNLALFGEKSIPAVMLYYMVNTTFFWTLGVHNIVQDTLSDTKNKPAFFSGSTEENFFSATGRLHCRYHFSLAGLQAAVFFDEQLPIYR